jgi:hypothetical protein
VTAVDREAAAVPIPASHHDLFRPGSVGVLTTLGPQGDPESTLVRIDLDGDRAAVAVEPLLRRRLAADTRVSLLVVDPLDTARFVQIRGVAECLPGDAGGGARGADAGDRCRIRARRITVDAIHR